VTFAALAARAARTTTARLGETVAFTREGASIGSASCILVRRHEPVFVGGEIALSEDHYQGRIALGALSVDPALGDVLVESDGAQYRVDLAPERSGASWVLILRKLTAT
jgi:hypothetical protein